MSIAHLLEDFDVSFQPGSRRKVLSEVQIEDIRLGAFENGYAAGWDDALKSKGQAPAELSTGLKRQIEDVTFPYEEALMQTLKRTESVLHALFETVLPEAATPVLVATLVDRLQAAIQEEADVGLELVVPAGTGAYITPALPQSNGPSVTVVEDDTLGPDQAILRLASKEEEFDVTTFTQALRDAIETTLFDTEETLRHG